MMAKVKVEEPQREPKFKFQTVHQIGKSILVLPETFFP